jgi:TPP-dependent pyruvate/acetoin dehydrogenase alpha subunit
MPTAPDTRERPDTRELRDCLAEMILIRRFEEAAERVALEGRIPGGIHTAIGQEAVAVGVKHALEADDVVSGTHRSHHHALAKGLEPRAVMAELLGKATGVAGGRGGSMHLADFERGLWGSNGIVGGGLGIALGAALGSQQLGLGRVAVGFFGDGGANTGRVWEFLNLAAAWKLPFVAVCENNLYAVETTTAEVSGGNSITARAKAFGLHSEQVDGQDVVAVLAATRRAVDRARAGKGASFLEMLTYRYLGHNTGENAHYRPDEEIELWRSTRDPIDGLREALIDRGELTDTDVTEMVARVDEILADAIRFAEESPWPHRLSAAENVSAWKQQNVSLA